MKIKWHRTEDRWRLSREAGVGYLGAERIRRRALRSSRAFTMIEIAISLAVIGIALVAIIGVLPIGMRAQRDNRERTLINQDATVFLQAIRSGAQGLDDLTNYVYAITNSWTFYNRSGVLAGSGVNGYTYSQFSIANGYFYPPGNGLPINRGMVIIGLLSTPEITDLVGNPTNNLFSGGYSNHLVAYVHSISGPAVEKPPQNNDILRSDSFSYHLICVNAAVPVDTNLFNSTLYPDGPPIYDRQLAANLRELRLTFLWPQLPNGRLAPLPASQTYRQLICGQMIQTNYLNRGPRLYILQPGIFTNAP
jgi:prepilin-type N-terminal cleavage/methylation domain-containing protein